MPASPPGGGGVNKPRLSSSSGDGTVMMTADTGYTSQPTAAALTTASCGRPSIATHASTPLEQTQV